MKNMLGDVCTEKIALVLAIPAKDPGAETRQQMTLEANRWESTN